MNLAESLAYLHLYQQWQNGKIGMNEAEISQATTNAAHAAILTYVPQLQKNHLSVCSKLRKCQIKRSEYNIQLRQLLKSEKPAS